MGGDMGLTSGDIGSNVWGKLPNNPVKTFEGFP